LTSNSYLRCLPVLLVQNPRKDVFDPNRVRQISRRVPSGETHTVDPLGISP